MRWLTLAILAFVLLYGDSVLAQEKYRRTYQPARRRFSSYMNLLRPNAGNPLPNYQMFYQPDRIMTQEFNQLNNGIRQNRDGIRINNKETIRLGEKLTSNQLGPGGVQGTRPELRQSGSAIRPTGTSSQYMSFQLQNFSHYYPAGTGGGGGRQR